MALALIFFALPCDRTLGWFPFVINHQHLAGLGGPLDRLGTSSRCPRPPSRPPSRRIFPLSVPQQRRRAPSLWTPRHQTQRRVRLVSTTMQRGNRRW